MRRTLTALTLLVALVVPAACGKGENLLGTVKAAAATTSDTHTARMSARVEAERGALAKGMALDGVFDFDGHRARFTMDPSSLGLPIAQKVDAVFDYASGAVMYLHFPQFKAQLGKEWLKIDLDQALQSVGVDADLGSIVQKQSGDPTSGLQTLRGAVKVDEVGHEKVRGTDTRHVRATIDVHKAAEEAPAEVRADMRKLAGLYKTKTHDVDVWLDDDGRVRRMKVVSDPADLSLPTSTTVAGTDFGAMTITYELYDFGTAADITVPPADQVADTAELMQRAAGAAKAAGGD
jgi:hypothetical protein